MSFEDVGIAITKRFCKTDAIPIGGSKLPFPSSTLRKASYDIKYRADYFQGHLASYAASYPYVYDEGYVLE